MDQMPVPYPCGTALGYQAATAKNVTQFNQKPDAGGAKNGAPVRRTKAVCCTAAMLALTASGWVATLKPKVLAPPALVAAIWPPCMPAPAFTMGVVRPNPRNFLLPFYP